MLLVHTCNLLHTRFTVHMCLSVSLSVSLVTCLCQCACTEELEELRKKEKEAGYIPDWELDAFMKAEIRKGKRESIVTDLVIKLLGLDVSAPVTT